MKRQRETYCQRVRRRHRLKNLEGDRDSEEARELEGGRESEGDREA